MKRKSVQPVAKISDRDLIGIHMIGMAGRIRYIAVGHAVVENIKPNFVNEMIVILSLGLIVIRMGSIDLAIGIVQIIVQYVVRCLLLVPQEGTSLENILKEQGVILDNMWVIVKTIANIASGHSLILGTPYTFIMLMETG